jgi:NADPH-dependent 2,4-dienoyl-CoA reductase/sulfur reductase-like enzyme/rhodanese-related sulfurtransferase/two-component sensor histidine kinase
MQEKIALDGELVGTLSHQLKSPITTIQSLLKTVSDGFTGEIGPQALQLIRKAAGKAEEADMLIADLLSYRYYSRGGKIDKEEIDFGDLVEAGAHACAAEASDKNVSLRVRTPEGDAVLARGDCRGLTMAVRNLVENAVKYTPQGGHVIVKLSVPRGRATCELQVTDSGYGIAAADLRSIFKPFFRSPRHFATVPGTGLGLAITKTIIEAHGGSISVMSKEGKGTSFTVTLPCSNVRKKVRPARAGKRIVIIGGVTAGPKAAARLRRLDELCDITIVEKSEFLSYAGCGLPSYISDRVHSPKSLMSTADNTVRDINFFESIKNIRVLSRTEATAIHRSGKTVRVRDLATQEVRELPYDVLVLATGARSYLPPIPGIQQEGVHSLHGMEDAEAIRRECTSKNARDVYIIGGGLISMETAESLVEAGARVTILEKEPHVLSSLFDEDISQKIRDALGEKGIKVVTQVSISRIATKSGRLLLTTDAGRFGADLVIVSAGVRPNSGLARKAGLPVAASGAIRVDPHLRTKDPSVYAIGDCAESVNCITGRHEYWPLGSISTKMGRIAADNIAGRPSRYLGSIGTAMFRNFGVAIARTGLTLASAREHGFRAESVVVTGLDKAHYSDNVEYVAFKLIADAKTRVLLGAQAYGRGDVVRQIQAAATAIMRSLSLTDVFDLDLGYSPDFNNPIDIVQTACCVLSAKIDGLVRTTTLEKLARAGGRACLVDVSPFADHVANAIPGSVSVPLENLRREGIPFDKREKCILYSRTSSRAYEAYRYLVTRGYSDLSILEGGYVLWSNGAVRARNGAGPASQ